MQITNVTVGLGMTESLPDYANVKPSLTLTATVESCDSVGQIVGALQDRCREFCQNQIDDALEAAGERPRFTREPLFRLYTWLQRKALVILPAGYDTDELPGRWGRFRGDTAQRYLTVMRRANEVMREPNCPMKFLVDLSDENAEIEVEVQEWWDRQEWYRAFEMSKALIAVKDGLEIFKCMSPFYYGNGLGPEIVRTADDLLEVFRDYNPDAKAFYVIDTQEELGALVDELAVETSDPEDDEEIEF